MASVRRVLILVRHAMPDHGPDVSARDWPLSRDGLIAAESLCARLPTAAWLAASSEAKAIETLANAGHVATDARFDEIWRLEEYDKDFRTHRRAYIDGVDHADWESREAVVSRFDKGVAEHLHRAAGRPVVIATHGMAMTLWLTATVRLNDPGAFWADLRFPDAHLVDQVAGTVVRGGLTK